MCSFVHANGTLGLTVVLPAKGSTRLQSCVLHKRSWFAGRKWYEVTVSVHSDEYDLDATFTDKGSGFYGCPSTWNYENGDVITAELYTWKIDSTNEVVKRRINRIY